MVVHDGLLLHAIGHALVAAPEGYRITVKVLAQSCRVDRELW